jgi:hypothetical protein
MPFSKVVRTIAYERKGPCVVHEACKIPMGMTGSSHATSILTISGIKGVESRTRPTAAKWGMAETSMV